MDSSTIIIATAVVAVTLAIWIYPISAALRSWRFMRRREEWPDAPNPPRVALIAPCCGLDQGFEDNVRAMLSQDYPNYRIIFVTGSKNDPAYPTVQRLIANDARTTLLTSGQSSRCGQKVNNMLVGVAAAEDAEVLAFVDSDARPHPSWLRSLVAPLASQAVGASTGYLWYRPERGGLWSWARAYAANISALDMAHAGNKGLWGGAMAIRRETFDKASVADGWQRAVSDDSVMSHCVRQLGLRLAFVPNCLTTTIEDCDLPSFYEFLKRHMVLVRACEPPLWLRVGSALTAAMALQVVGVAAVGLGSLCPELVLAGSVLLAQLPLLGGFGGLILLLIFKDRRSAAWWPIAPLVIAVTAAAFAASTFTRRIEWRGIGYELISADRAVILGSTSLFNHPWLTDSRATAMTQISFRGCTLATVADSVAVAFQRVREGERRL